MEKFKIESKLLKVLGNEIEHLNDLRDLLSCLEVSKHKLRRVYLLQDLLKSVALEVYKILYSQNNGNK